MRSTPGPTPRVKSTLLPLTAFLVAAGLQTACVDNQLSLVISNFAALTTEGACAASPTAMVNLNNGILDVGIVSEGYGGYVAGPIVTNRLLANGTTTTLETNAIQLTGVEVELRPSPNLSAAIPNSSRKFFVPAAGGLLKPGASSGLVVEVVPTQLALQLANSVQAGAVPERLIVRIRPVGKHAGVDIDGGPVDFPLEVCKYCLSQPPVACPSGGLPMDQIKLGGCYPAQDQSVTCCRQQVTLCGADVPVATAM